MLDFLDRPPRSNTVNLRQRAIAVDGRSSPSTASVRRLRTLLYTYPVEAEYYESIDELVKWLNDILGYNATIIMLGDKVNMTR